MRTYAQQHLSLLSSETIAYKATGHAWLLVVRHVSIRQVFVIVIIYVSISVEWIAIARRGLSPLLWKDTRQVDQAQGKLTVDILGRESHKFG